MDIQTLEYVIFVSLILFMMYFVIKHWPKPQEETNIYTSEYLKCESPIERRLYNGLTQHELYPRTQYPCGPYRIDLAFPGKKIAIEADGKDFHSSPEQKAHDRRKDNYLKKNGWTVLRFSGRKIHRDLPGVIKKIEGYL